MKTEKLKEILELHSKWLKNEGGSMANLYGANLSRANLSRANLYGAECLAAPVCIEPIGSENGILQVFPTDKGLLICRGCFTGSEAEFLEAVEKKHNATPHGEIYRNALNLAKAMLTARGVEWGLEKKAESK